MKKLDQATHFGTRLGARRCGLPLPLLFTLGCAGNAPPAPDPRPLAEVTIASATPAARPPGREQPGTGRCEWPKHRGGAPGPSVAIADDQIDAALMAVGVSPRTDAEKKRTAERERIDDALEGTIGCEVSQARGEMPLSYFTFAIDEQLPEVARCLYSPGRARKERLFVRLSFDDGGRPQHAQLEPSRLDATTIACIETVFSAMSPASYQADPKTGEHATDELQANASARVELEIDMPPVR